MKAGGRNLSVWAVGELRRRKIFPLLCQDDPLRNSFGLKSSMGNCNTRPKADTLVGEQQRPAMEPDNPRIQTVGEDGTEKTVRFNFDQNTVHFLYDNLSEEEKEVWKNYRKEKKLPAVWRYDRCETFRSVWQDKSRAAFLRDLTVELINGYEGKKDFYLFQIMFIARREGHLEKMTNKVLIAACDIMAGKDMRMKYTRKEGFLDLLDICLTAEYKAQVVEMEEQRALRKGKKD